MKHILVSTISAFLALGNAQASEVEKLDDLLKLDISELAHVSIASKREETIAEAPGIISVISSEEIKSYGGNNLFDILERLPHVYTLRPITFAPTGIGIDTRGQTASSLANHVLILINGRPVRESHTGGWQYNVGRAFPIDTIERIEMVRGPGSVLYGSNAFSGAVNIVTKSSKGSSEALVEIGGGSDQTLFGDISYRTANKEYGYEISFAQKGFDSNGWNYNIVDTNGDFGSNNIDNQASGTYLEGQYNNTSFMAGRFATENAAFLGAADFPMGHYRQEHHFLNIGHEQEISNNWKANFNFTYNGLDLKHTTSGATDNEVHFNDALYEMSLAGKINEQTNLITGLVYDNRKGSLKLGGGDYNEAQKSAYFQLDTQITPWLKAVGGLQVNRPENLDKNFYSPRFSAIFKLTDNIGAKLLYGKAFRSPTASETNVNLAPIVVGNPDLKPETITTYDAQIFYKDTNLETALTFYHSKTNNIIGVASNPDPISLFSFQAGDGRLTYKGIEWEGKWKVNANLSVLGSISYNHGEDNITDSRDIGSSPHLLGKLGAAYSSPRGYSVGLFDQYYGDPIDSDVSVRRNPAAKNVHYITSNLSLNLNQALDLSDAYPDTTVNFYIDNLLDETIYANNAHVRGGRALYGKISIKF